MRKDRRCICPVMDSIGICLAFGNVPFEENVPFLLETYSSHVNSRVGSHNKIFFQRDVLERNDLENSNAHFAWQLISFSGNFFVVIFMDFYCSTFFLLPLLSLGLEHDALHRSCAGACRSHISYTRACQPPGGVARVYDESDGRSCSNVLKIIVIAVVTSAVNALTASD